MHTRAVPNIGTSVYWLQERNGYSGQLALKLEQLAVQVLARPAPNLRLHAGKIDRSADGEHGMICKVPVSATGWRG